MAGINPHPAVKAISPQAPMTDTWMGDDFFHQGAFRLSYGFEYAGIDGAEQRPVGPAADRQVGYLRLVSPARPAFQRQREVLSREGPHLERVRRPSGVRHSLAKRAVQPLLKAPAVPTLTVGGWWDQEDRFGPLATYEALERGDTAKRNFLVMGPWNHGGWRNPVAADAGGGPGNARCLSAKTLRHHGSRTI